MLATAILAIVLVGIFSIFNSAIYLADTAGSLTQMSSLLRHQMEMLNNVSDFNSLTNFDGTTFVLDDFAFESIAVSNAVGVFTIDSLSNDLRRATIAISYSIKGGRIIGEDTNLNGALDGGEDINNDGRLSSPVEATTIIARES